MVDQDLAFSPAWRLRELIGSKELSPVELTELFLGRIEKMDHQLNAYLTVTSDKALAAARDAEEAVVKGETLGPLHGIPISIKDLELTSGIKTTLGSLVFKQTVPQQDSAVVERVRKSGAIILGKTNTPEFGLRGSTENRLGDACRNPWDTSRTAGGSSGGAGAALVSGLCPLATGSDGGGSIRIPASFCGVYGIKPTFGRVPRYGGLGRAAISQFSQSGPMARTVWDTTMLLQILAGPDSRDPSCLRDESPDFLGALKEGVRGLSLAWSSDLGYAAVDPQVVEIASGAAKVFEELGCTVEEADMALENPFPAFWDIFAANAYASYGHLMEEAKDQLTDYGQHTLEHGAAVSGACYSRALLRVEQLRSQMRELMDRYDLLLTPTMAVTAFPVNQPPSVIGGRQVEPFWAFLPFQHDRPAGGQHPLWTFFGRIARWPSYNRAMGRGDQGASCLCCLRGGPPLGPLEAFGVLVLHR